MIYYHYFSLFISFLLSFFLSFFLYASQSFIVLSCVSYFKSIIRADRGERSDWGERKPRENKYDSASDSQGREGGRSLRSISTEKSTPNRAVSSSGSDTDDWGASSSARSTSPITPSASSSSFSDSFNIAAWGDSLSSTSTRKDRGQDDKKRVSEDAKGVNRKAAVEEADDKGPEDFDRLVFIISYLTN